MQAVAAEMNLSETAFVCPAGSDFGLRWFTPAVEVDLCGHATLAAAHALWSEGIVAGDDDIRFRTRSGVLTAASDGNLIELDFPATPPDGAQSGARQTADIGAALGAEPVYVARSDFDLLVVVGSAQTLRSVKPDFRRLREFAVRGVIVTSVSDDPRFDFLSRFFAPAVGVDEDPVTGSAHCCLGPYWGGRLGKTAMTAFQASSRGGVVHVRLADQRVVLGGRAVTVFRAELTGAATA